MYLTTHLIYCLVGKASSLKLALRSNIVLCIRFVGCQLMWISCVKVNTEFKCSMKYKCSIMSIGLYSTLTKPYIHKMQCLLNPQKLIPTQISKSTEAYDGPQACNSHRVGHKPNIGQSLL